MRQLWAPWRYEFIKSGEPKGCFFCDYAKTPKKDKTNQIIFRGNHSFCVTNKYPYNIGHIMIAPYRHTGEIDSLSKDESAEIFENIKIGSKLLKKALKPHGLNIGANLGKAAGAGVPGHLHFHIVPRWNADTNFMPILSDTKVMITTLSSIYEKLCTIYSKL